MQWLVGFKVGTLSMRVQGSDATEPKAECPFPPAETIALLRKRLVVLIAGNEATRASRWPESNNNWIDWQNCLQGLREHFNNYQLQNKKIKWSQIDGIKTGDQEADNILQESIMICKAMVSHPVIENGITKVYSEFLCVCPDNDGMMVLESEKIVSTCECEIGEAFRIENQWDAWLDGK